MSVSIDVLFSHDGTPRIAGIPHRVGVQLPLAPDDWRQSLQGLLLRCPCDAFERCLSTSHLNAPWLRHGPPPSTHCPYGTVPKFSIAHGAEEGEAPVRCCFSIGEMSIPGVPRISSI